jgi:integrase
MGRTLDLTGIKARPSSVLIDLRSAGLKQVTWRADPTPKNLAYAARMRAEILVKHQRGTLDIAQYFPDLAAKPADTFDQAADQWLAVMAPRIEATTKREYEKALGRFRDAWGPTAIGDMTAADIITVLAKIDVAAKTFNNIASPLRGVLSLAFRMGKTRTDLSLEVIQRPKEQEEGPDPLGRDEIARLLDAAGDWRNYFEAAIFTGMRPSEQIALRWADVDLRKRTITVRQARVRGSDKATKTRSIRTILLPDEALAAIKRQQAISRTGEHVFLHPISRTRFADTQPPSDAWKRICKLAGIRARDARQTRHTYATLMLLAGAKPAFVSRQMGHANSQMFFKTYSKWLDSDDDWREVRKLSANQRGKDTSNAA